MRNLRNVKKDELRRVEGEFDTSCKYCEATFICDDDLAHHESTEHGSDLSEFYLDDDIYRLKG